MDYVMRPSLQHITLTKIAIELWIQTDFLKFASESQGKLEAEVLINVQNLPLPHQLKKELKSFIKPIGSHILQWFEYLYKYYRLFRKRPKAICWTPYGTIDKVKTIKVYLKERSLRLEKRFKLACDHCLVDEIESLWKEMTEEEKLQLEKCCNRGNHVCLQQYWINSLKGKPDDLYIKIGSDQNLSSYYDGCCRAMLNHNPTAILYFFEKSSPEDKEVLFPDFEIELKCNYNVVDDEPVCVLLSRMNENQQVETFKEMPEIVLCCLLSWPYQRFFLETANRMWEFLNSCDFEVLLIRIIDKIVLYGGEYRHIFLEYWRSSPDELKRSVIRPDHFPWQELYDCFVKGEEVCKMINSANVYKKRLFLLIGNMRVNITMHSEYREELVIISYRKNAEPKKILYDKYQKYR